MAALQGGLDDADWDMIRCSSDEVRAGLLTRNRDKYKAILCSIVCSEQ